MPIDQQTRRRMSKTGLTALDRDKACPGYVLYSPMATSGATSGDVYLINLEGEEVHHWAMPHPPGLYGYLLPNGNLFYGGKVRDDTWDRFLAWNRFKGGVMLEATPAGEIVWEHHDREHHHDARRTESGGAVYLTVEEMPRDLAAKVKGGVPEPDSAMWADVIVEVDAAGDRVWEWHAAEHLDVETDVITFNDLRDEWSHGNTVVPLPDGRVMFSFRNISTVGIIDKASNEIVWKLGYETLAQQHDPSMLAIGNILIFDNGSHRGQEPLPSSRVIEIDPNTNQILWEYRDNPAYNFFSPYISGARRLVNGNTLITEGMFGRMFQVTPEGEVVWEYINPHFFTDTENLVANRVFRATHYMPGEIPWL
ncbi:MAG: aryl sulfotransferase [SAR202 cluster bacterium Io17-Chloro-G6]|nr:MAG: aryl sulfotransferase [SAR202 cluster bacterium Io17-Chloro-G6]